MNVHYVTAEGKKDKMIRTTIKEAEELLQPYSFLMRCHRAFIVNTRQVTNVKGNALGYKLKVHYFEDEIPVSRNYTKVFREQMP